MSAEREILATIKNAINGITGINLVTDDIKAWQTLKDNQMPAVMVTVDEILPYAQWLGRNGWDLRITLLVAVGGKTEAQLNDNYDTAVDGIVNLFSEVQSLDSRIIGGSVLNVRKDVDAEDRYGLAELKCSVKYNKIEGGI